MAWGKPRVLDFQPDTGIRELFYYDPDRDRFRIETIQDIDPILEKNRSGRNETDERANWKGDLHHIGSIPLVTYYKLMREGILDDQKAMKRWLNDPVNRVFRSRPGRV
jgi:hypothetical protein